MSYFFFFFVLYISHLLKVTIDFIKISDFNIFYTFFLLTVKIIILFVHSFAKVPYQSYLSLTYSKGKGGCLTKNSKFVEIQKFD